MDKLFYISKKAADDTIRPYLEKGAPDLRDRVVPLSYEYLLTAEKGLVGNYLFTDMDRASRAEIEKAVRVANAATNAGHGCRVINWPNLGRMRYELLRELYERKINPFNVYRYTEARTPARFPVFVRRRSDHTGSFTKLLTGTNDLEKVIDHLLKLGCDRDDLLIVEFLDTRSPDGHYRKYSSFLIEGEIFFGHLLVSDSWVVKNADIVNEATIEEEIELFRSNPFAEEVRTMFKLARLDFGRIDFSLAEGRVIVWEINPNPMLWPPSFEKYPGRFQRAIVPYYLPKIHEGFMRLLRSEGAA